MHAGKFSYGEAPVLVHHRALGAHSAERSAPSAKVGQISDRLALRLARYNYLEYLMKQLAKFREAGASYGQKRSGKIHVGVIRERVGRVAQRPET